MIALSAQDIDFLHHRGSNEEDVLRQFHYFETGFPFARLECAAAIGNGILKIADADRDDLVARYDQLTAGKSLLKFVPASGAASRMFKEAYSFLDGGDSVREAAIGMLHTLPHLALYDDLCAAMAHDGLSLDEAIAHDDFKIVFEYILTEKGLNYGNKPKGVLKFHRYADGCRTPFEEHLVEAALYARQSDGTCHLHFTVSPQHLPLFTQLLDNVKDKGFKSSKDARKQVEKLMLKAKEVENFGNGRFVENTVQKIIIEHAMKTREITDTERLLTFEEEDIPDIKAEASKKRIGF